jgi:hypothetical protein
MQKGEQVVTEPLTVEVIGGKTFAEFRLSAGGCTCSLVIPVGVDPATAMEFVAGISQTVLDFILHLDTELRSHGSGN